MALKPTSSPERVPARTQPAEGAAGRNVVTIYPQVDERNIDQVEKETIDKVNKTLSALETAIASWDAAKEKPEDLRPKFQRYRRLHDVLSEWEAKVLRDRTKDTDYDTRIHRLHEFVDICHANA
jgi:hypothetical protein